MGILNSKHDSKSTPLDDLEFWAKHSGTAGGAVVKIGTAQNGMHNDKDGNHVTVASDQWSKGALELLADVFPEDLWILVFEFLDKKSQSSVKLTCKSFDRMANLANNSFLFSRDPGVTVQQVMHYLKIDPSMMVNHDGNAKNAENETVENDIENESSHPHVHLDRSSERITSTYVGYGNRLLIMDLTRLLINDDELLYLLKCCPLVHSLRLSRCTRLSSSIFYKLSIQVDSIKTLRLPGSDSDHRSHSFAEWIETYNNQHGVVTERGNETVLIDDNITTTNDNGAANSIQSPKIRMHLSSLSLAMFRGRWDDTFIQYVRMEPSLQCIEIDFEGKELVSFTAPGFVSSSIREITCLNYISHAQFETSLITMFPNMSKLCMIVFEYNYQSNPPVSKQLFQSLEQVDQMTEMEFFDGRIEPEPLMRAVRNMSHLTKLTCLSQQLPKSREFDFESMEHLMPTIRAVQLGNYTYKNVHKLQMAHCLTSLTLDSSVSHVFDGEELGATLVALAPRLIHLSLGSCTIHNHKPFVDAFSKFQRLEMIDLGYCQLESKPVDQLVHTIADNPNLALSLKELQLFLTKLDTARHLVLLVRRFLSLRCIDISQSKIEDDSVLRELCDQKKILLIHVQSSYYWTHQSRVSPKLFM